MTKGLLYSPFATTELFYITPGAGPFLARKRGRPHRSQAPHMNAYMNL